MNYRANVWHHPLMALGETSDFLVVDRAGPGDNLEEYDYPALFTIEETDL
nr:ureidoglycolate lyase [Marinicella sp. W31]MDC2878103.1 ureidoglycolate lyase [Marinicella sp. W31]